MIGRPIPWGWLSLAFIGYGVIGFSIATIVVFYFLPQLKILVGCLLLTAFLVMVLTFTVAIGAGLMVGCTIAFSAAFILRAAYFWNYVVYIWSDNALRIGYLVVLGLALGTVWTGVGALVCARNDLLERFRKVQTFLVLTLTSLSGLGSGWAIAYLLQR